MCFDSMFSLTFPKFKQSQISGSNNLAFPRSGSVVGFVVTTEQFARAVPEPISIHPANNFARSVSDIVVVHNFGG